VESSIRSRPRQEGMEKLGTRLLLGAALILMVGGAAEAQEEEPAAGGIDAKAMANANNPLADMNAFNFHNFFAPSLYGVPNQSSNTMNLRGIMVAGRHIIRATVPLSTLPTGLTSSVSGLGDINVFDAIVLTGDDAKTMFGVGPLLVMPTATDDALGAESTWQAGAAMVAVRPLSGGSLIGGLVTWQTDFAGGDARIDTNLMTAQVFLTMSIGKGWYFRSSPLSVFDFQNDVYLVPFGLGMGKVFPMGGAVVNAFVEPQMSVYHKGTGLPSFQLFFGLNLQFPKR